MHRVEASYQCCDCTRMSRSFVQRVEGLITVAMVIKLSCSAYKLEGDIKKLRTKNKEQKIGQASMVCIS